jgi:2-dehydro-3-deoxyphosphogluconate aldolase / (4S)-4-hydroxy-2-oxoglutarate aldolase
LKKKQIHCKLDIPNKSPLGGMKMSKYLTLQRIINTGIVAVIRAESSEEAKAISHACIKGHISAIEVTFTVPHALQVIESLVQTFSEDELLIGAGTILDSETARLAILAGAKYIVSPAFDEATAKLCNRYGIPYMPGCMTVTEMIKAMEFGADIIKLFPGSTFGPSYVKAIKGPLPHIQLMPTGGVSIDNIKEWFQAGVVAVGVGGELTSPAKKGQFDEVTLRALAFVEAIKAARSQV